LVSEPIALCEVRGWTGTGLRGKHDVIIVLDRSGSTFRSSGMDVDGDGVVGHDYSAQMPPEIVTWTSDFGDTIISAEILAARRLIERLDPATTRMGIVSFGGNADLDAPLGSTRAQLLAALDKPPRPNENGTYMYGALEAAIAAFEAAPAEPGPRRQREILLLTDGVPTARTSVLTYVISGLTAALAGMLLTGYSGQAYLGMGDARKQQRSKQGDKLK
jgi:hypothetical protein